MIEDAVAAIGQGKLVVLPTDTVYGLCTTAYRADPVRRLQRLKGKPGVSPLALVASDLDLLLECIPELRGRAEIVARALLPGPYTLVLSNPARKYPWLTGTTPEAIGVRVPALAGDAAAVLREVGAIAATSANLHGGADPRTLAEVPEEIRARCAVCLDGGALPGVASTVLDFTGPEPKVLRDGAAPAAEAIERVATALA